MVRDHTARTRIRAHLAHSGAVVDSSGYATTALRDAVGYEGSAVGFIQLLAAMEAAGELTRDIRGKRTYAIAPSSATLDAFGDPRDTRMVSGGAALADYPEVAFDGDQLMRALIREAWAAVAPAPGAGPGTDQRAYLARLSAASASIDALLADLEGAGPPTR